MTQRTGKVTPTGVELTFGDEEIIVSKTDLEGRITYANEVFQRIAGYKENELLGRPHSIIRHPDMPRCVFRLLWTMLQAKKEVFAYVVNMARNGDHYWVFAHVTPSVSVDGRVVGYHSSRRKPEREAVEKISKIYKILLEEEAKHSSKEEAMKASTAIMVNLLESVKMPYEEFVFSLA